MEPTQVNIAVKKIKDVEFFVNEELELTDPFIVNISFDLTTNFNLKENTVEILLTTIFTNTSINSVFMKLKSSNVFLFLELANYYQAENDAFTMPDNVLVTFLSLSISHSRALLAKNALGTKFSEMYIPIVNPTDILKQLFSK